MNTRVRQPREIHTVPSNDRVALSHAAPVRQATGSKLIDARADAMSQLKRQALADGSSLGAQLQAKGGLMRGSVQAKKMQSVAQLLTNSATPVIQRVVLTRRMRDIIGEANNLNELNLILGTLSYSEEVKTELRKIRAGQLGFDLIDEESEPEVDEGEGAQTEFALNVVGHQANVYDEGMGPSYQTNANAIQLARTPGAMTGPKDYPSSNFGKFEDSFYILDGKGGIDFSVAPTKTAHTSYTPVGKKKKQPLKHTNITWTLPHHDGVIIDLSSHPNIGKLDKTDRDQHFGMADSLYSKHNGWKTAKQTADLRKGKWTWHHLPTQYHMILVDMEAHAQHGHNGGVFLW